MLQDFEQETIFLYGFNNWTWRLFMRLFLKNRILIHKDWDYIKKHQSDFIQPLAGIGLQLFSDWFYTIPVFIYFCHKWNVKEL